MAKKAGASPAGLGNVPFQMPPPPFSPGAQPAVQKPGLPISLKPGFIPQPGGFPAPGFPSIPPKFEMAKDLLASSAKFNLPVFPPNPGTVASHQPPLPRPPISNPYLPPYSGMPSPLVSAPVFAASPAPFGSPPQPVPGFQPGKVQIFNLPPSPQVSLPVALPPVDPNKCPFCGVKQIDPQCVTPCNHGYCSTLCLQTYIKSCYDGFHFDNIPCIACRVPFPLQFMLTVFGDENEFRRHLREYIEQILRTRVCGGNEALFNDLTNYHPQPPFNCMICHNVKPFKEKWDLSCPHTLCKECLTFRVTDSISRKVTSDVNCPYCSKEIPYIDILCLVDDEGRRKFEQIVDKHVVVDKDATLIRYDCPIHPFFIIYLDAGALWVKCNICNVRYCTRCPPNTLYQGHACPNLNNPPYAS